MTTSADPDFVPAYGFKRPGAHDARSSLDRIYGDDGDRKWIEILADAGLDANGPLDADAEFGRIVAAFLRNADPVVGLCGQALKIRQETFRHLCQASTHIGGAN
jgi:hypothetical protein